MSPELGQMSAHMLVATGRSYALRPSRWVCVGWAERDGGIVAGASPVSPAAAGARQGQTRRPVRV